MGEPKHALILPDGRSMIEHVAAALSSVCPAIVILGPDAVCPDLPHVHDLRDDTGPLAGIEALLASESADDYLVCPCDLPLVTPELLGQLGRPTDAVATVFRLEGREQIEALPARISASALPLVRELLDAGTRSVWKFMEQAGVQRIDLPASHARLLHNVNTPAEYAALRQPASGSSR